MAFPSKLQMPVGAHERSQHDLSAPHVTTSNFMELNVAKCMEMVPGQSIEISHDLFSRLEPLPVPTFGLAEIRNKAFFVPLRTLWPAFTDFDNDTFHIYEDGEAIPTNVPLISNYVFFQFLTSPECATIGASGASSFSFISESTGNRVSATFTPFGRYCYKIIRSLGFSPIMDKDYDELESCLPLLGLAKLYLDWFFPAQYVQSGFYASVAALMSRNSIPSSTESYLTSDDLLFIFEMLRFVSYDSDYFTSAWDNPVSPNDGSFSEISINDITLVDSPSDINKIDNTHDGLGAPSINNSYGSSGAISQYSLDALKSMTDYMRRNQLVGSRSLDRHLARYGYKLAAEKLNRSILINDYRQPIQFGDVTSTASTDGATLGDYAGKAISYGENSFTVDSGGEFGYFYIITTIIPKTHYYQGINRHVKHITRTDFWKPEYDSLGVQAISQREYYSPLTMPELISDRPNPEGVFGFTSRYAEYKVPYALVTGDYVDPAINTGKDAWTLFRDVSKSNTLAHNFNVVTGVDADQYLRIFNNTSNEVDHFNIIHNFRIMSSFPGKSLFDTYEFKDEDESQKVSMDVGGTTVS